jgi:hypothetical protein
MNRRPLDIMERLSSHPCALFFLKAIDPDVYPDYYLKIVKPIDLSLIKDYLQHNRYNSLTAWAKDMRLIRDNTCQYFGAESLQCKLANHLFYLFTKEFEYCTDQSLSKWTRLYSSRTTRLLHKLSNFPETMNSFRSLCSVVTSFAKAIPRSHGEPVEGNASPEGRNEATETEIETATEIEAEAEDEDKSDGISNDEQNRFLRAIGLLNPIESKRLLDIVRKFHPDLPLDGCNLEIHVDVLSSKCWRALIAFTQDKFRKLGLEYPV